MTTPENACQCERCRSACRSRPGFFLPEQIAPLAAALNISVKELFDRFLAVDYWLASIDDTIDEDVFILMLVTKGEDPGDMVPYSAHGTCIWYDESSGCAVHALGKPAECARWRHDTPVRTSTQIHEETAKAWDKPEHQALIHELLGRRPVALENDGSFGLFSIFK